MKITKNKEVILDSDWEEFMSKVPWQAYFINKKWYVARKFHVGKRPNRISKMDYLHRIIADATPEMVVDHINGNTLDNRRENLRLCTIKENVRYQKVKDDRYKGVRKQKNSKTWFAEIIIDGIKHRSLGFYDIKEAAKWYNEMALKYFKEYAILNKI